MGTRQNPDVKKCEWCNRYVKENKKYCSNKCKKEANDKRV